jgi:divalent metal cation (Fe/Co/Zn/Cd) transporter
VLVRALAAYKFSVRAMSTNFAFVSIVAIICLCLLAGYVVYTTGSTAGITDIGHAIADIIYAIKGHR